MELEIVKDISARIKASCTKCRCFIQLLHIVECNLLLKGNLMEPSLKLTFYFPWVIMLDGKKIRKHKYQLNIVVVLCYMVGNVSKIVSKMGALGEGGGVVQFKVSAHFSCVP